MGAKLTECAAEHELSRRTRRRHPGLLSDSLEYLDVDSARRLPLGDMADNDPPKQIPDPPVEPTSPLPVSPPEDTAELSVAVEETMPPDDPPPVEFPVVLRGYDRDAVDAYVARVSAVIEDLQASRLPQAAVRRALDRVGEETAGILRQAEETAEQMTTRSRAQADDRLQRAESEARELRAAAEKHVRALDNDTERIWQERQRLIDDTRTLADTLLSVADEAEERFPPEPTPGPAKPAHDQELKKPTPPELPPEPGEARERLGPGPTGPTPGSASSEAGDP